MNNSFDDVQYEETFSGDEELFAARLREMLAGDDEDVEVPEPSYVVADESDEFWEDDGQPTEYEEWQDVYGGDDWDQGQFDYDEF
jgi:hypothetical protein